MLALLEQTGRWPPPKRPVRPDVISPSPSPSPAAWQVSDVQTWLRELDVPDGVREAFASERVDGSLLRALDADDLRDELQATVGFSESGYS